MNRFKLDFVERKDGPHLKLEGLQQVTLDISNVMKTADGKHTVLEQSGTVKVYDDSKILMQISEL